MKILNLIFLGKNVKVEEALAKEVVPVGLVFVAFVSIVLNIIIDMSTSTVLQYVELEGDKNSNHMDGSFAG